MTRPSPPSGVRVIDLDIPFLSLTWFFVKASFALAFAMALTSWVWVVVGSGIIALTAALVVGLGVPEWFAPQPTDDEPEVAAPAPPAMPEAPAPAPPLVTAPAPAEPRAPPPTSTDANREATEAAMRAEIERHRRERQQ